MQNILQHINLKHLTLNIRYLEGIRYLSLFILSCNLVQAQDFQTELENAAKALYNPIYAIIEMPNEDGTVEYIEVLKSDIDKINKLEKDFLFIENRTIKIDDILYYIETTEKTHQRTFYVYTLSELEIERSLKMIKAPSTKIEVIPATYDTVTERVLAKSSHTTLKTIPAEYETITETIMVKPPVTKTIACPPKTEYRISKMEKISEDSTRWEKRKSPYVRCCFSSDPNDCQVWHLVKVPARYEFTIDTILIPCEKEIIVEPAIYETITKTILKTPAKTKRIEPKPEYQTITKRVVKTPVCTRTIEIPAEYKTIYKNVIATDAQPYQFELPVEYLTVTDYKPRPPEYRMIEIPPVYKTITKQILKKTAINGQPAQYETIIERIIVKPAESRLVAIPSGCGGTQTKRIAVRGEHLDTLIAIPIHTIDQIKIYQPKSKTDLKKVITQTKNIKIFPNPTTDFLNIQTAQNIQNIEIIDLKGSTLMSKTYDKCQNIQLPVSHLNKGAYIILIKTETDFITSKFVVNE